MSKRIPIPSADDLRLAALWCDNYEGSDEGGENVECEPFKRVAAWLEQVADDKELREVAKEHGLPFGRLRARLHKGM